MSVSSPCKRARSRNGNSKGFVFPPNPAQLGIEHVRACVDIWEFIVEDNPPAARHVREDILDVVRQLVLFPLEPFPRGQ